MTNDALLTTLADALRVGWNRSGYNTTYDWYDALIVNDMAAAVLPVVESLIRDARADERLQLGARVAGDDG